MHIYVCTHSCIHEYIYTYTYTFHYIYIYTYIYIYIYMYMYMYIHIHIYIQTCIHMHICIYTCVPIHVQMMMYLCICLSIYLHVFLSIYPSIYLSMYLSVLSTSPSAYLSLSIPPCMPSDMLASSWVPPKGTGCYSRPPHRTCLRGLLQHDLGRDDACGARGLGPRRPLPPPVRDSAPEPLLALLHCQGSCFCRHVKGGAGLRADHELVYSTSRCWSP